MSNVASLYSIFVFLISFVRVSLNAVTGVEYDSNSAECFLDLPIDWWLFSQYKSDDSDVKNLT